MRAAITWVPWVVVADERSNTPLPTANQFVVTSDGVAVANSSNLQAWKVPSGTVTLSLPTKRTVCDTETLAVVGVVGRPGKPVVVDVVVPA